MAKGEFMRAIEAVYEAEMMESDALLALQELYDSGLGSPVQRKEARELLGIFDENL